MNRIVNLTDDAVQNISLVLADGTSLIFTLTFVDQQLGWFISDMSYGTFQLSGYRVFNSPNMFYQYRNQIPFGMMCQTTDDREPSLIQDFSSGTSNLYILTAAEVAQYVSQLSGG